MFVYADAARHYCLIEQDTSRKISSPPAQGLRRCRVAIDKAVPVRVRAGLIRV
jgi:hypothetical protein